ncbi:zinc finger protein 431-like [Colias croceus]|uniref:zinc finger protein 431-like n=1 Tax=Colias crocea TaxID=72248 RepID=UPI001E27D3AE|nr:zinc finger protein 431-like [Colias croceus]
MSELIACRVCLVFDNVQLFKLSKYELVAAYEFLTGSQISINDGLPQYLCTYCRAQLIKCMVFKNKCCNTQDTLRYMCEEQGGLTITDLLNLSKPLNLNQLTITTNTTTIDIEYNETEIKEEVEIKEEIEEPRKRRHKKKEYVEIKYEDNDLELLSYSDNEIDNTQKEFEDFNVEVIILTKEEQIQEIEARKNSFNYLNSYFKCDKCYKGFITHKTYKNHMMRHDPSRGNYVCDVCLSVWSEEKALRAHIITSHQRKYVCKLCDHVSRSTNRAKEHNKWHNGYTFDCKICGASFSKSTSQLTHIRLQHPTNNSCDICGESFLGEYGLRMHKKRAHLNVDETIEDYTKTCETCGVRFKSDDAMKRHLTYSGDGKCVPVLRPCPECGEAFESEEMLEKHAKEHPLDGTVTCFECNRSFANARSHATHVQRVHLGIKMKQPSKPGKRRPETVVCEICGKECITKATLICHQRIHSGEKPFQCSECPKKFSVYQRLQIHLRTHTGECPYKCERCPKAFKHKAALNRHSRVHTGIKPYGCAHCGKTFSQSNSMKLHVNTVHLRLPAPYRNKKNK